MFASKTVSFQDYFCCRSLLVSFFRALLHCYKLHSYLEIVKTLKKRLLFFFFENSKRAQVVHYFTKIFVSVVKKINILLQLSYLFIAKYFHPDTVGKFTG